MTLLTHDKKQEGEGIAPPLRLYLISLTGPQSVPFRRNQKRIYKETMPIFVVNTNIAKDDLPADLLSEATKELAIAIGKPTEFIAVHFHADQIIMIGGNEDPCALCSFYTIEKIGCAETKQFSKLLCGLLNKQLGISPDRQFGLEQHYF
ncbi:macrophage migration inhibitory factor-like isoform X2 [Syngnathus acus]|uniref:macrophage migration inhibitory factor-like isoform X2 n=1 Tax=Syngnathus acus TaxID=161584 RepID=UPI001885C362|nr:macrophage migration inhibitory factor-like isoform X2 [Syngnathus acus]